MRTLLLSFASVFLLSANTFDNSTQSIPFNQDWSAAFIINDNDWSMVPGIVGYKGSNLTTATGADPQNLLAPALPGDQQVYGNQFNPDFFNLNGVAFFTLTDRTIALQGGPDASAPHIVLHLNTMGHQNILVSYLLRDIDGSPDNALTPVALQYRIGNSGNFINIPAGFVPDATRPGATLSTQVVATLPSAAQNQSVVQVRIITANASGNDEWVGIDNIAVSSSANAAPVLTSSPGTTSYIHPASVVVDGAITVTDNNNASLASASIQVFGEFPSVGDMLQFVPDGSTGNISGVYDQAQGLLTLNSPGATASLAQWQAALRLVRYYSMVIPQHASRYVRFAVSDGISPSNVVYKPINLSLPGQPVVTCSAGTTAFLVGTPVIIDNALTITDPNSATLFSATIQFSGAYQQPEDVLVFANDGITMGNISGSFDPFTNKLSLLSIGNTATLAQWQAALRSVKFSTGGQVQTYNRSISFTVNDGGFSSAEAKKVVSVSVSTPPVVSTSVGSSTYAHGSPLLIDPGITVYDVDNSTLVSAIVEFTNYSSGDNFLFTNDGSSMGNITGNVGAPNNTLTLTGAGSTLAQWQAALRSVKYVNALTSPVTTDRTINFKVNDGGVNSNTASKTISYLPLGTAGINWNYPIHTVEPNTGINGDIGTYTSLLVVDGKPAIAYRDNQRGNLVYRRANDASGTSFGPAVTIDSIGNVGLYITLMMVNGSPAVSYYDQSNKDLKFVRAADYEGNVWFNPVRIASSGDQGLQASMQIVNGNPAIAYGDISTKSLKYVRANDANGFSWGSPVAFALNQYTDEFLSISLQVINGNPAIAAAYLISDVFEPTRPIFYRRSNDVNGTSWSAAVSIGSLTTNASRIDMKEVNGHPAIVFQFPDLKYRRATDANGAVWGATQSIDPGVESRSSVSLEIVKGYPAVAYYVNGSSDLMYIRASDSSGNAWQPPRFVDYTGSVGSYASLKVVNGHPAISYYDITNQNLKYTRAIDSTGINFIDFLSFDSWGNMGSYNSCKIINGNPAIAFYNSTTRDLYFQRALDPEGSAWDAPVLVDQVGDVGKYTSLQLIAGNPAISYFDETNGRLKYVRANDAMGAIWSSPINVDIGSVGRFTSLVIANGNPAISYEDFGNFNLKYVRSSDALGSTWGTPVTLDATGQVGDFSTMQIINGKPAIAYRDLSNTRLKFIIANDVSGQTWANPVIADPTANIGSTVSLQEVNGVPAIVYHHNIYSSRYVRANDPAGTSWSSPITIDAANAATQPSLQVIGGIPAIAYEEFNKRDIKFITAADLYGNTWNNPVVLDTARIAGDGVTLLSSGNFVGIFYHTQDEALPYFIKGTAGFASAPAHHFRSRITGSWNNPNSWESSPDNINWYTATLSPDAGAASITVRNGHTITVTANISIASLLTETGGQVIMNSGVQALIQ